MMPCEGIKLETTDVVICGCGPTGAMLSAYLGKFDVPNIVLEREAAITTDPRGIALDEDGIRLLQGLALYDKIYSEIGSCMERFQFIGGNHQNLSTPPFLHLNYSTTEGGTGHVGFICHKQPVLEKYLRHAVTRNKSSEIRLQSTVVSISEDEDWVYVRYHDHQGTEHFLRCRYLVGADGKTGYTRKKYLEPKGIRMERVSQTSYEEVWVALNWKISLPTPKSHPDFPLWRLGYTPEEVYDAFFPREFRFLCNPSRPAVCGRFGLPQDRLWRFEFVVRKCEDGDEMAKPNKIKEVVWPYLTHPGSRYRLNHEVRFPEDCVEVLRSRPFRFSARSCNEWALGRVILCGDAAHVFPPFGGQGIASGFRDASALAWRLSIACRPGFRNYPSLFQGWYAERKQQLERSLAATIANGEYVTASNPVKIALRNCYLWLLQLIPSWRRWLEMGPRKDGMPQYRYAPGMAFRPDSVAGKCFPQVYCRRLGQNGEQLGRVQFTDDVIFAPHKKSLFQVVVLLRSLHELRHAHDDVQEVYSVCPREINMQETTYILHDVAVEGLGKKLSTYMNNVFRVASGPEFAADFDLCARRPDPLFYKPDRIWDDLNGKRFVIVRPDRFVFAACDTKEDLEHAMTMVAEFVARGRC